MKEGNGDAWKYRGVRGRELRRKKNKNIPYNFKGILLIIFFKKI
jgi:hypothetical protein